MGPCYDLSGCSGCLGGWVGASNKKLPLGPTVSTMLNNHWGSGKLAGKNSGGTKSWRHKKVDKMKTDRWSSHSPLYSAEFPPITGQPPCLPAL